MAVAFLDSFCRSAFNNQWGISSNRNKPKQQRRPPSLDRQAGPLNGTAAFSSSTTTRTTTGLRSSRINQAFIARTLRSFINSGRIEEALSLFESTKKPDTFLWNLIIRGCANAGLYEETLGLYGRMQDAGMRADHFTFPFVIKSCANLLSCDDGRKVHARIIKVGLDLDIFICNSLVFMYSKFGLVDDAERVFCEMPVRDEVSWNSLVDGYASNGEGLKSFLCLKQMQEGFGLELNRYVITSALTACSSERCLKQGKEIHCYAIRNGFEFEDVKLQTALLDMYCKNGEMIYAERIFCSMSWRNVVTWNALIGGYALNSEPLQAFASAIDMQATGMDPDEITLVNILPGCAEARSIHHGKLIHSFATRRRFLPHTTLETALIDMYAKCGNLKSSQLLFDRSTEKNLISWNAMISAYVHNGSYEEALRLFMDLQKEPLAQDGPDAFTISSIVAACAKLASLRGGKQIHSCVLKSGYWRDSVVLNSIIYMYAMCGDLNTSRQVFDRMTHQDLVSWNALIMGYAIHGQGKAALEIFSAMKDEGLQPDKNTFTSVLTACSITGLANEGWLQFGSMQQEYGITPVIEHYGCMVDLLGRTGDLQAAVDFINKMPLAPTPRIWGSLLTASRNNRNVEVAEFAAEQIFHLEHDNTGCYVLLASMYADAGKWEDTERVVSLMKQKGLSKTTSVSLVELDGESCTFVNGDKFHAQSSRIHELSSIISRKIGEAAYDPGTSFNPVNAVIKKANLPNRHSVRLAVIFGLISSKLGSPVLVKKNVRICSHCHHAIKLMSGINGREIIIGDTNIYHHFVNGRCSCGDYW